MDFNYDADVLSMSMVERIREACRQTRQREEEIRTLTEQNRDETRPVRIEENRARIDRLNSEIEEFNQMTIDSTKRYAEQLDDTIRRNLVPNLGRQNILEKAIEVRLQLNEVLKEYSDIFQGEIKIIEYRSNKDQVKTNPKDEIENQIEKFKKDCKNLEKHLNSVQASLILNDGLGLTAEISELDSSLGEISSEAEKLKGEIDKFRESFDNADFSMSVPEIQKTIDDFRDRIKDIKKMQAEKYNAMVAGLNNRISLLKGRTDLDPEVAKMIDELFELVPCKTGNIKWNSKAYLKEIDYNKLVELSKKVNEIEDKLSIVKSNPYEDEINYIENEIEGINNRLPFDKVDILKDDINQVATNINSLMIKLANDKDKISEEEYNKYFERLIDAQHNLANTYDNLNKLKKDVSNPSDYKELLNTLNDIDKDVEKLNNKIDSLNGEITEEANNILEAEANDLGKKLADIEKEIEKAHNDGKIDAVQYQNLTTKLKEIIEKYVDVRGKLKNPGMVKGADIYAILNGRIDGVVEAIDKLEEQVNQLEKPIKNKEIRKSIDNVIENIEREISAIEKDLELHKEDEEKYNQLKQRLDEQKERLAEISKKYRKKCPFLVKAKKSARDFYKKHKKLVLIAAGLAALALIYAVIGPILIPAIMHGNLILGHCAPALRGVLGGINNVLGKAIHAKVINHIWTLANGVQIAPSCASASLLKGIAISGMGTAALVTPLVIAVKQLINKMNLAKLKEDVAKGINNGKEKINGVVTNIKDKTKETKEKATDKVKEKKEQVKEKVTNKKHVNSKKILNELKELLQEYQKSKLSFEEFCEQKELSEEDRIILENLNKKVGGR